MRLKFGKLFVILIKLAQILSVAIWMDRDLIFFYIIMQILGYFTNYNEF